MRDNLLECFTAHYISTALWSSMDDDGNPLDLNYDADDLAPEALDRIKADCAAFFVANAESLHCDGAPQARDFDTTASESERIAAMAGHDFWLTRNGHGAGFWDGDWPEPAATALDNAAKAFGSCDLYVGDDGKIHA